MTMSAKNPTDDTSTPGPSQSTSRPPLTSRVALKTDVVVIGAGQAGLSSAYHLKKRGLASGRGFIVLDQSPQPGGAWQFRWPSLKLSTVNRIHDLPGMRFSEAVDTEATEVEADRKSTRLNSSHANISYAVFCLKKKKQKIITTTREQE